MGQFRREFIKSTSAAPGVAGIALLSVGRIATDALNPPLAVREYAIATEPSITELAADPGPRFQLYPLDDAI